MFNTNQARSEAIEKLREYNGLNPYILKVKRDVIGFQKTNSLTDFAVEYILTNYGKEPIVIGKTYQIADWFGEGLKDEYMIEFVPQKVKILLYLGKTTTTLHCVIKYRQNMEPLDLFIPQKALLGKLFVNDYHNVVVDFGRYDRLSKGKDPYRQLKPHQKEGVQFLLDRK